MLSYAYKGALLIAMVFYVLSAVTSIKFIAGLTLGEQFRKQLFRYTSLGLGFMLLMTILSVVNQYLLGLKLWQPVLIVNCLTILLNAATLHTIYWKWNEKWSAWLAMATLFVDANLRFLVIYFLA